MTGFRRSQSNVNWLLFAAILAVVALLAAAPMSAQSVASLPAKPSDYVSDFAHVLSPATVAELDNVCSQLDHTKANAQFAVVTVNTLAGDYPEDYADQLETKWKMGKKGSDRGLLFLLAVQDHKYRIEPGYGLEGVLNDAKVGDIGRSMVPDLKAGDYNNAVMLAVGQLAQDVAADAGVSLSLNGADRSAPASRAAAPQPRNSGLGNLILFLIVIILFAGFSIVRILLGAGLFFGGWGGRWGGPWIGGGMGGGGWGSGGGGFSGGGGGGFGGFGGGGFGGGGAGGSW